VKSHIKLAIMVLTMYPVNFFSSILAVYKRRYLPLLVGRVRLDGENRNYRLLVIPIFQRCSGSEPSSSPTGSRGC
jgi:hypothetical protein